jgi:hypothetical protein
LNPWQYSKLDLSVVFHNKEIPTLNYRYTQQATLLQGSVECLMLFLFRKIHYLKIYTEIKKLIRPQEEVSITSNININTKIYKTKTSHVCFV